MNLPQLRRIRWNVRAVLVLGVAASVCANVLHARRDPVAQIIAGWPPLALLITIELLSRVPVHRRLTGVVRLLAAAAIAAIAAWVSYWHMAAVASRYGETDASPYLLPLSVDGLIVVASVSLVELAGRIRTGEDTDRTSDRASVATDVRSEPDVREDTAPDTGADVQPDTQQGGGPDIDRARERTPRRTSNRTSERTSATADTAVAVARLRTKRPDITQAQAATELGKDVRTIRRHWQAIPPAPEPVNGRSVNGRTPSLTGGAS